MIKKFKRRKVYARFKGNIWAGDLAEIGLLSSKDQGVKYIFCVVLFIWSHMGLEFRCSFFLCFNNS